MRGPWVHFGGRSCEQAEDGERKEFLCQLHPGDYREIMWVNGGVERWLRTQKVRDLHIGGQGGGH